MLILCVLSSLLGLLKCNAFWRTVQSSYHTKCTERSPVASGNYNAWDFPCSAYRFVSLQHPLAHVNTPRALIISSAFYHVVTIAFNDQTTAV